MRSHHGGHRDQAYLVTEAPQSRAAEISQRQRRYLVMMGIRVICFIVTVVAFVNHAGWFTLLPAAGAIGLPYFAVIVANTRQPAGPTGFRPYEPNWPARYQPPPGSAGPEAGSGEGSGDGGQGRGDAGQGGSEG